MWRFGESFSKKESILHANMDLHRCNMDSFLLNKKGLEEVSILHKNFCNMHIARRNMHIAIESILPLTYYVGMVCTISVLYLSRGHDMRRYNWYDMRRYNC